MTEAALADTDDTPEFSERQLQGIAAAEYVINLIRHRGELAGRRLQIAKMMCAHGSHNLGDIVIVWRHDNDQLCTIAKPMAREKIVKKTKYGSSAVFSHLTHNVPYIYAWPLEPVGPAKEYTHARLGNHADMPERVDVIQPVWSVSAFGVTFHSFSRLPGAEQVSVVIPVPYRLVIDPEKGACYANPFRGVTWEPAPCRPVFNPEDVYRFSATGYLGFKRVKEGASDAGASGGQQGGVHDEPRRQDVPLPGAGRDGGLPAPGDGSAIY